MDTGRLHESPYTGTQRPLALRWLTPREQKRLLAALDERLAQVRRQEGRRIASRDRALILFLLHTGLALREVWLRVEGAPGHWRYVPLNSRALAAARDLLAARPPAATQPTLLVGRKDTKLGPRMVHKVLAHYGAAVGRRLSPGMLRHTFAHLLGACGLNEYHIAQLLGVRALVVEQPPESSPHHAHLRALLERLTEKLT